MCYSTGCWSEWSCSIYFVILPFSDIWFLFKFLFTPDQVKKNKMNTHQAMAVNISRKCNQPSLVESLKSKTFMYIQMQDKHSFWRFTVIAFPCSMHFCAWSDLKFFLCRGVEVGVLEGVLLHSKTLFLSFVILWHTCYKFNMNQFHCNQYLCYFCFSCCKSRKAYFTFLVLMFFLNKVELTSHIWTFGKRWKLVSYGGK
jgi:hypothetical protein